MPYKKMSVNTAVETVTIIKVFELRYLSRTGGLVDEPVNQVNIVDIVLANAKRNSKVESYDMILDIH